MGEFIAGFIAGLIFILLILASTSNNYYLITKNTLVKYSMAHYSTTTKAIEINDEWKKILE